MSDLPANGLLQQLNAHPISGEHLELLGKKAAALWGEGRCSSLSKAVVETVKHAGLSPAQVRRVIEFTNTEAYLNEFRKEGSEHKVIDFGATGPAHPSEVMQDLNDGGGGSVFDPGTGDYQQPPKEKAASAEEEQALASLFASTSTQPDLPEANPYSNTMELRDKLASVYEWATSEISTLENMFEDLRGRLFHQVKQASLQGHALSEIVSIWQQHSPSEEHVKVAFRAVAEPLVTNGVFSSSEELISSLKKVAHADTPNPEHPLVVDFKDFCSVLNKLAEVRAEQEEAGEGLARLTAFFKEAGSEGLVQRGARLLGHAAHHAEHAGTSVGEALFGEGKGGIVGKAARYGTYALPALGTHEVYRQTLKHNPGFQAAKSTALSAIPGTEEYNAREYELALRGQGMGGGMGY